MNKHIYIQVLLVFLLGMGTKSLNAQGNLVNNGTAVTITGGSSLFVKGNLINKSDANNGNFSSSNGGIMAVGKSIINLSDTGLFSLGDSTTAYILNGDTHMLAGPGGLNFFRLNLNTGGDSIALENDISIGDSLVFQSGNLFLNGFNVALSQNAAIGGESENSRVYGNSGFVHTTRPIGSGTTDVGGMGLLLNLASNAGLTTVKRGHAEMNAADTGMFRYFEVTPAFNGSLDAEVSVSYFESELNGLQENRVALYQSHDNGLTWKRRPASHDSLNNVFTQSATDSLSRWTIANDICIGNEPVVDIGADTILCSTDSLVLNAGAFLRFAWSTGDNTRELIVSAGGTYEVAIVDSNGCTASDSIVITEIQVPYTSLGTDTQICTGDTILLDATDQNGSNPMYAWSTGDTNPVISYSQSTPAPDTVWATLQNGACAFTDTIVINGIQTPVVDLGADTGLCQSGTLVLDAQNPGAAYAWSTGDTVQQLQVNATSVFTVTVTNGNICSAIDTIAVFKSNLAANATGLDISCNGMGDGQVHVSALNGVGDIAFSWSMGDTVNSVQNLSAGTYYVTITDSLGCTASDSAEVEEPASLTVAYSVTILDCETGTGGAIDLSPSGGTPPYMFNWASQTLSGEDVTGLSAGTYDVMVMDVNQCATFLSIELIQPQGFTLNKTFSNIGCHNANDGFISYTPFGGTAPFSYAWNTGDTSSAITSLAAGTYTVEVEDSNGCTQVDTTIISNPAALALVKTGQAVSCFGAGDGAASVSVSGGTQPYSYLWNNGDTTVSLDSLAGGKYFLTVTDQNNCTINDSVEIAEPLQLSYNLNLFHVGCNGGSNGSIDLEVSGGTLPYTYSWADGPTTQDRGSLLAGTYGFTVSDANGCEAAEMPVITEPDSLVVQLDGIEDVLCHGGATGGVFVSPSGGTAPYSSAWNNGSTAEDLQNVLAGNYSLTITDSNNCTVSGSYGITEPASALALIVGTLQAECGLANGSASVQVSGGVGPYSIFWDSTGGMLETDSFLMAGVYPVHVTDANGCVDSAFAAVSNPGSPSIVLDSAGDVDCYGNGNGFISVTVTGGNQPYSYSWNSSLATEDISNLNGGTYNLLVTDDSNCTASQSFIVAEPDSLSLAFVKQDVSCFNAADGLAATVVSGGTLPYNYNWSGGSSNDSLLAAGGGEYIITLTDANGCTKVDSVEIIEPASLGFSLNAVDVSCFGAMNGSIDATVTGGTQPYQYQWDSGNSSEDLSNLGSGNYVLTVTDNNGCAYVDSAEIMEPAILAATSSVWEILCNGDSTGEIGLSVSGGTFPYSYQWNTGDTTGSISSLDAGNYSVTITDGNGCLEVQGFNLGEPSAIQLSLTAQDMTCGTVPNGAVSAFVTGGVGPYTYLWNTGDTVSGIDNLMGGNYVLTVTDSNGCTVADSAMVSSATVLAVSFNVADVLCNGDATGAIDLAVTGGVQPYAFNWGTGQVNEDLANLAAGEYTVAISDDEGCTVVDTAWVSEPSPLLIADSTRGALCSGANSAFVYLRVSGGTVPYSYVWGNGSTEAALENIPGGEYIVTVTDSNGCTVSKNYFLANPAPLQLQAAVTNIGCGDDANSGSVGLTATGGTGGYAYMWSTGSDSASLAGLTAGEYAVTVSDENGCSTTGSYSIALNGNPVFAKFLSASFATSNDTIRFVNLSSPDPEVYFWDFGDSNTTDETHPLHRYISRFETDGDSSYYHVTLIASNSTCTDSVTKTIGVENLGSGKNIDLREVQDQEHIALEAYVTEMELYPVPTRSDLNYKFELSTAGQAEIMISSFDGRILHKESVGTVKELAGKISLDRYAQGIYYFTVLTRDKAHTMQFVKL